GGDHGADFVVLKNLVEPRLLDVDQFAANWKYGLELPVAALFGGTAGRVTFDNIQLRVRRIAVGAIGQFAGQTAAGERGFADRFAGLARGFAGTRSIEALVHDSLGDRRIGVEAGHQAIVSDRLDDAFDLGREQFHFGLRLKLRVAVFYGNDGRQALAHVIAGDLRVLLFEQIVRFGVLVDRTRDRVAETAQMRAAVGIVHRVGVTEHLVVVAVVVLQHDLDVYLHFLLSGLHFCFFADRNRLRVQRFLAFVELLHELLDAVLVEKRLLLSIRNALVDEGDFEAGVQKRQFPQALGDAVGFEFGRIPENFRVGLEGDERAGALGFAGDFEFFDRFAALELHVVDLAVARHIHLEPLAHRVHALGADTVSAARESVASLPVFAARVKRGEHQFDAGNAILGMDVHRDAAAFVPNRNRTVHMNRN